MLPEGLLQKVRRIEIKTSKLVDSVFGGEYHSVFRGQGIEFADVRESFFLPVLLDTSL